jgi:hypothetical protein
LIDCSRIVKCETSEFCAVLKLWKIYYCNFYLPGFNRCIKVGDQELRRTLGSLGVLLIGFIFNGFPIKLINTPPFDIFFPASQQNHTDQIPISNLILELQKRPPDSNDLQNENIKEHWQNPLSSGIIIN